MKKFIDFFATLIFLIFFVVVFQPKIFAQNLNLFNFSNTIRNWNALLQFPTASEVSAHNAASSSRSPYIVGWIDTNAPNGFAEYCVDFKADFIPNATYCSLANFYLDYSSLKQRYKSVNVNAISGYAGLQRQLSGTFNSILSFWDVECVDFNGRKVVIRPQLIYPTSNGDDSFDGEGTGAHQLIPYIWQPNHWYRMLLQLGIAPNGNTTMQQWICDLSDKNWVKLCEYDLGAPNVIFKGNVAIFLENFSPSTSGDIRTMECKNFRIKDLSLNGWKSLRQGRFLQNFNFPGSYRFGVDGDTFFIITSGVSGKAGLLQSEMNFSVSGSESDKPY